VNPPPRTNRPVVSVSLVTFNGTRWLDRCLRSLRSQTFEDFEVLLLDNASSDGTLDLLREQASRDTRMTILESPENLGYAAANNRNIASARGEFVLLLNQDVELDERFLASALAAFEGRPRVCGIQGRLLTQGPSGERTSVIDTTGLEMHRDRRVVSRRQAEPQDASDLVAGPVWGVDGPAPLFRLSSLQSVSERRTGGGSEILDEDFFMYKEDVDLAWRLRRAGWTAWYEPRALAWHGRGAGGLPSRTMAQVIRSNRTIPRWIKRISWRNQRLMQLKNETAAGYLRDLPWILKRELLSLGFMVVMDPRRLGAVSDFLRLAPRARRKRRGAGEPPRAPVDSAGR
jgi:GT2 family glycosyltransferase